MPMLSTLGGGSIQAFQAPTGTGGYQASGGNIVEEGGYIVHYFLYKDGSSQQFTNASAISNADIFVIGGGGGGGTGEDVGSRGGSGKA